MPDPSTGGIIAINIVAALGLSAVAFAAGWYVSKKHYAHQRATHEAEGYEVMAQGQEGDSTMMPLPHLATVSQGMGRQGATSRRGPSIIVTSHREAPSSPIRPFPVLEGTEALGTTTGAQTEGPMSPTRRGQVSMQSF